MRIRANILIMNDFFHGFNKKMQDFAMISRSPPPSRGRGWGRGGTHHHLRPWLMPLLLLIPLLLPGCGEEPPRLEKQQPVPAFSLPDLAGKTLNFPQDVLGQVVVLRFWADWCPFCAPEMTAIEPVYLALRDRGLQVLAVNVRQDRETAARFIARLGISYPVLLDQDGHLARQYGVSGLPTTYFIDRAGRLHRRILGEADPALFDQIVRELL